jgi:glycosyltransferase involved in cell wall biosynthesis
MVRRAGRDLTGLGDPVHIAFAIPGDLARPTGGYAYARKLLDLLPVHGLAVSHLQLPAGFPLPDADELERTVALCNQTPKDTLLLFDGLAYGALPGAVVRRIERAIVALVHHPLCLEQGVSESRQAALRQSETEALACARAIVVTSPATRRTLVSDFGVAAPRIHVAPPGTDPAPRARGSAGPTLRLLAVGSVVPRKGYPVLVEALAALRHLDWRLDIAGALDPHSPGAQALIQQIEGLGLGARITLLGAVGPSQLAALYDGADVFVMASLHEGFGMVVTEALARGLAIVCTTAGALADTVPSGAALMVEPGDAHALAAAIGRVIGDATLRRSLADAAWREAETLTRWPATAAIVADVLKGIGR